MRFEGQGERSDVVRLELGDVVLLLFHHDLEQLDLICQFMQLQGQWLEKHQVACAVTAHRSLQGQIAAAKRTGEGGSAHLAFS